MAFNEAWTRAEEDALLEGVRKHGEGKWEEILKADSGGARLLVRKRLDRVMAKYFELLERQQPSQQSSQASRLAHPAGAGESHLPVLSHIPRVVKSRPPRPASPHSSPVSSPRSCSTSPVSSPRSGKFQSNTSSPSPSPTPARANSGGIRALDVAKWTEASRLPQAPQGGLVRSSDLVVFPQVLGIEVYKDSFQDGNMIGEELEVGYDFSLMKRNVPIGRRQGHRLAVQFFRCEQDYVVIRHT